MISLRRYAFGMQLTWVHWPLTLLNGSKSGFYILYIYYIFYLIIQLPNLTTVTQHVYAIWKCEFSRIYEIASNTIRLRPSKWLKRPLKHGRNNFERIWATMKANQVLCVGIAKKKIMCVRDVWMVHGREIWKSCNRSGNLGAKTLCKAAD